MRLFTAISSGGGSSRVKHYHGLPPVLTGGEDTRQELGCARFLVIEENPDGIFLYRYGAHGECVGDTWHMNVDDAKHQASFEYGDGLKEWTEVPPEVEDVAVFGLDRVATPD
jgi:hypothetical protein